VYIYVYIHPYDGLNTAETYSCAFLN